MNKSILIIDDNLTICLMLKSWLVKQGYDVETASHAEEAKKLVREQPYDLILSDIRMPDIDGFAFLSWVKRYDSDILVIMMTGYADIESAVESMKSGATDYISKPIDPDILFKKIDEAFRIQDNLKKSNKISYDFITPPGKEFGDLANQLRLIAENKTHSLIIGGRGSGKSSVVKYIYEKGINHTKPLITLDANDLTSKNRGAFGVNGDSFLKEKFREAKGGLFYIRGVDQLNIHQQDDLLNFLTKQKKDENYIQLVLSSEKTLLELKGVLIPKLFDLLEKESVILPSLKGNGDQILFFATHFIKLANNILNRQVKRMDSIIQKELVEYEWPGNIQELKNCIIKAVLLTEGDTITGDVVFELFNKGKQNNQSRSLAQNGIKSLRKENYEKEKIYQALELAKGNKTLAASILNIDRKTLYNKIKLYNVKFQN